MAFFLIGSFVLGLAWIIIFFIGSFIFYLFAWFCSLIGIFVDVSGDRNIWFLFLLVLAISIWVFSLEGSNFGYFTFVFLTGVFMVFKTADTFRIASG